MDSKKLKNLFSSVKDGSISVEDAVRSLKHLPYEDISFAKVGPSQASEAGRA